MSDNLTKQNNVSIEGLSNLFSCESIMFCLDISGSMSGSRINKLKQAFRKYIIKRLSLPTAEQDLTGLVVFPKSYRSSSISKYNSGNLSEAEQQKLVEQVFLGIEPSYKLDNCSQDNSKNSDSDLDCSVVFNLSKASIEMSDIFNKINATGQTPMGDGLFMAIKCLDEGAIGLARIVLMSDGGANDGRFGPDYPAIVNLCANAKNESGIIVDTVGICLSSSPTDEQLLKDMAKAGGGCYTSIADVINFDRYLQGIAQERAKLLNHGILLLPGSNA